MNRKEFITSSLLTMYSLTSFARNWENEPYSKTLMPIVFVGHGSPMNAIESNEFTNTWKQLPNHWETPKAILCISAHWETQGTKVLYVKENKTIHDFYGFPDALNQAQYNAPAATEEALFTRNLLSHWQVATDDQWGLDHGTWSVLKPMYPLANIPVFQLSLDTRKTPQEHYNIAKELMELRKRGVLIVSSGNIVHNLRMLQWGSEKGFEWAELFNNEVKNKIQDKNHQALIDYKNNPHAKYAVPTPEHYLPLLYTTALQLGQEVTFFNDKTFAGSISMTGYFAY
jgi:4,5-DOPA dioxygenase extradiol